MADFKNYDPDRISVTLNGKNITGFAAGTFVRVERETDSFTKKVGAKGDTTRVRSRNKSGMVTITLLAASPSNTLLNALLRQDEKFGTGYGELQVINLNGDVVCSAPNAWVKKFPNVEYGDDDSDREWVLECDNLDMNLPGSVE